MTVLAHLERLAHGWRARRTAATGGILADFGADPWTLLECVPNYVNVVASFNAAYAGHDAVVRRTCCGCLGDDEAAAAAEAEADTLARAVVRTVRAGRALAGQAPGQDRIDRPLPGLRAGRGPPARRPERGAARRMRPLRVARSCWRRRGCAPWRSTIRRRRCRTGPITAPRERSAPGRASPRTAWRSSAAADLAARAAQRRARVGVRRAVGPGDGDRRRTPRPAGPRRRGRRVEPGLHRRRGHRRGGGVRAVRLRAELPDADRPAAPRQDRHPRDRFPVQHQRRLPRRPNR